MNGIHPLTVEQLPITSCAEKAFVRNIKLLQIASGGTPPTRRNALASLENIIRALNNLRSRESIEAYSSRLTPIQTGLTGIYILY